MTEELTTVRGFKAVQRAYKKNLYLKHIVNKESKFLAEMYASRGISVADKDSFLEPKLRNLLPPVNVLKDTETAAKRIIQNFFGGIRHPRVSISAKRPLPGM